VDAGGTAVLSGAVDRRRSSAVDHLRRLNVTQAVTGSTDPWPGWHRRVTGVGVVNLRLTDEESETLLVEAEHEGRSMQVIARAAIAQYVPLNDPRAGCGSTAGLVIAPQAAVSGTRGQDQLKEEQTSDRLAAARWAHRRHRNRQAQSR
jgi:hypothetical protein